MDLARRAAESVESSAMLQLMTPVSLGIVCFRVNPVDRGCDEATLERINREVLARAFWDELAFFSSTSLKGVFSLRLCIVNHTTTWEDVSRTLDRVVQLGKDAMAES